MRFFADRTTTLLQIFHVIVDGLYDSVPILLSFMIVAFGAQEKDAGVILSVAALLGTLAGLGTKGCSQRFGFLRTLCLITGAYGVGYAANTFSQNIWFSGFFFVIAMMGYGVFHNAAFSYLTVRTERSMLGKVLGDFTAIGDIGRIPITAFAGFLAAWSFAGIPGWRIVCALFGAVACCITLYLLWIWLRNGDAGGSPCEERKKPQSLLPPLSLLRDRHTASTVVANILDGFSGDQIFAFLPFLLFAKGMDPKVIGSFTLAFTVGCFAGKMACGRLVGIFGSRKVFITSKLLMSVLLAVLVTAQGLPVIIVTSILLGIVTKGTVPVLQTLLVEPVTDPQAYDDLFAVNTFARGSTNILTPLLFGFIASAFSAEYIYVLDGDSLRVCGGPRPVWATHARLAIPFVGVENLSGEDGPVFCRYRARCFLKRQRERRTMRPILRGRLHRGGTSFSVSSTTASSRSPGRTPNALASVISISTLGTLRPPSRAEMEPLLTSA